MYRKLFYFGVSSMFMLSSTLFAKDEAASLQKDIPVKEEVTPKKSSTFKAGIINVQQAILETDEGKNVRDVLEAKLNKEKDNLVRMQKELEKLDKDFAEQQALLSEADKAAMGKVFQTKMEEFQKARASFQQRAQQEENLEAQKILQKMNPIVTEMAKKNGYSIVYDQATGAIVYAEDAHLITADVIKKYNETHKVEKKSAATKPAAAK